jgi:hypothetical protein
VKTDATVTGTAGLSLDLGSSAEGLLEQAPRKRRPTKKNLAKWRGLVNAVRKTQLLKAYESPVSLANRCKPYAKTIILS